MIRNNQYVMLMSSLPPPGEPFKADQTAISLLKLQSRLKMLKESDFERHTQVSDLVAWVRLPMDKTDEDIIESANSFCATVKRPVVRKVVESTLEVHTILSALRRRRLGAERAPDSESWGFGPWTPHIERNWDHPTFKLEAYFPWIPEADRLLHEDKSLELEKLVQKVSWDLLTRIGGGHYFDFEAVVIYVLKWDMVKRWTRFDSERAVSRFREKTKSGLGKYADLYV